MSTLYICRICEKTMKIPDDAVLLGGGGPYKLYRFASGEVHDLKNLKTAKAEEKAAT